jgi:DNA-binding response OmpR family regulator
MKKVLIAEDDYFIRDIYQRTLKNAGFEVNVAVDGEDTLQKATSEVYDIILLDILMPKLTGIDVLRKLREKGAGTEETLIVMTTNLGQDSIIKEALKIGADGYLIKAQLDPDDLVNEVNKFFQLVGEHKAKALPQQ